MRLLVLVIVSLAAVLSAPALNAQRPVRPAPPAAPAVPVPASSPSGAAFRPGDIFEMRLSGMPADAAAEFAAQYTIGEDGTVGIPLVGMMKAAGMTPAQFSKSLEQRFIAMKLFTTPTVIISTPQQARFVTVGGGVKAPQTVVWSPDLTLSSAVKRAGGASDFGNIKKTKLLRDGKVAIYNLKNIEKDPSQNPKLLPGDEVEVPE